MCQWSPEVIFWRPCSRFQRNSSTSDITLSLCREVWFHFTLPGTFSAIILAIMGLCTGQGWKFVSPQKEGRLRRIRSKKDIRERGEDGSAW